VIPFYLGVTANFLQTFIIGKFFIDGIAFFILGLIVYAFLRYKYGEMNFENIQISGPYDVGCTTIQGTEGNFCLVHYPINKGLDLSEVKIKSMHTCEPGGPSQERLDAQCNNSKWSLKGRGLPAFMLRDLMYVEIPTPIDVPIADDFLPHFEQSAERKLVPMVFSHGLLSRSQMHSLFCREMASHGMIILVPDHNDGSCSYTINYNSEKPVFFDDSIEITNFD
jgi:hypothetical protein